MEYDAVALSEINLLGDVLAAAAHAGTRIPPGDLDRVLRVAAPGSGQARRAAQHRETAA